MSNLLSQPPEPSTCYRLLCTAVFVALSAVFAMDIEPDAHLLPRAGLVKTIVAALPVTPDPTLAADGGDSGSDDGGTRLEYVTQLEMSCDNKQLAAALSSLEINLYAADTMDLVGKLKGHTAPLTQLAFDPSDASSLFSASEDGTVRCGEFQMNVWQDSAHSLLSVCLSVCASQLQTKVVELRCCCLLLLGCGAILSCGAGCTIDSV